MTEYEHNCDQMYVKNMSEAPVPPLAIKRAQTPNMRLRRKFVDWDNALESMLSRPISPDLESTSVTWKKTSVLNADPRIDPSQLGARLKPTQTAQFRAKDQEMRTRELMVAHMVTAPLSPRKPRRERKFMSTRQVTDPRFSLRDKHEVESVVHERQRRANNTEVMAPVRKVEHMTIARGFGITVTPALRGTRKTKFS